MRFPPLFHAKAQVQARCLVYTCAWEEKETKKEINLMKLSLWEEYQLSVCDWQASSLECCGVSFSLTDGRPPHKGDRFKPPLCNHQAPETQYHTNLNQMWVSYSGSTTTELLFSGNDLVNGAFGVCAPEKGFKMGQKLSCSIRKTHMNESETPKVT